jgi:Ribosomal protein S8e
LCTNKKQFEAWLELIIKNLESISIRPPSSTLVNMGITRDSRHKRSLSGARPKDYKKKRAHEKGRQAANTRIGPKRIHTVRVRGGNLKFRALRLER